MIRPASLVQRWLRSTPRALAHVREDVQSVLRNDPAARTPLEVVLTYPGLHALWMHRIAHDLWKHDAKLSARVLSHANRFLTGIEIHPGARIGHGVFIDHGMGVVIGETAKVGDRCILFKGVLLGGTTRDKGTRHPQLGEGVVVGSNACILGAIEVGDGARIGAGSVVVRKVPPGSTVVGIPARVVQTDRNRQTRLETALDHANLPDPVSDMIRALGSQNERLRARLEAIEHKLDLAHIEQSDLPPDLLDGELLPPAEG